jgi:hypothetical protein
MMERKKNVCNDCGHKVSSGKFGGNINDAKSIQCLRIDAEKWVKPDL